MLKKDDNPRIGRSRGGLSTKIHVPGGAQANAVGASWRFGDAALAERRRRIPVGQYVRCTDDVITKG